MSCTCFEGYTGNGVVSCNKISKMSSKELESILTYSYLQLLQLKLAVPLMMSVLSLKHARTEPV